MKYIVTIPCKQILNEMTVDYENGCDAHNVKVFSKNHSKHSVIIKSEGSPSKETSVTFKAKLNEKELIKLCDFITKEFKSKKGKK